MVVHSARSHEDAEAWDLEFWQRHTPEERLSALVAIHRDVELVEAAKAWDRRIEGTYGRARAYWIDLDSLITIKSRIDHPRHQEDVRILRMVRERLEDD